MEIHYNYFTEERHSGTNLAAVYIRGILVVEGVKWG